VLKNTEWHGISKSISMETFIRYAPAGEDMESCSVEFPAQAFADLLEKDKNGRWLDKNFESLQIRLPNMFIAVYRASVLDSAETLDELVAQIEEMGVENISQIVIGYIPEEDLIYIL
jgi:hypothetical protein